MSDECLMTLEFGFPFYVVYQAVMRKFTLAKKLFQTAAISKIHELTIRCCVVYIFFSFLIHIACELNFVGKGKLYFSANLAEKWTVTCDVLCMMFDVIPHG